MTAELRSPSADHLHGAGGSVHATAADAGAVGCVLAWVLRRQRRSIVLWGIAVAAVSAIYASFFDVMDVGELEDLITGMPEGLIAALGYDRLGTPAGYLGSTVYGLLGPILLLVFAIAFAARVLAGAEEDGVLELELSAAVSRRRVLLERYTALVLHVAILTLALSAAVTVIVIAIGMDVSAAGLGAAGLGLFLLTTAVATVTFAVGAITGRRVLGLAAGSGLAVLAYLADALAAMLDDGRWLEMVSPFSWYLAGDPLVEGVDVLGFAALLAVALVALAAAILAFERRDLGV